MEFECGFCRSGSDYFHSPRNALVRFCALLGSVGHIQCRYYRHSCCQKQPGKHPKCRLKSFMLPLLVKVWFKLLWSKSLADSGATSRCVDDSPAQVGARSGEDGDEKTRNRHREKGRRERNRTRRPN